MRNWSSYLYNITETYKNYDETFDIAKYYIMKRGLINQKLLIKECTLVFQRELVKIYFLWLWK